MRGKKPKLTRLMKAENAFRIAYQEHVAWGQKMVRARTELLEANAEERAKLAIKFPDDPLIQAKAKEATDEMLEWYKKIGVVQQIGRKCANCDKELNPTEVASGVSFCLPCEESIDGPDIRCGRLNDGWHCPRTNGHAGPCATGSTYAEMTEDQKRQ